MLSAHVITASLCLLWSLIPPHCATPVQSGSSEVNINEASQQLVKDVRTLTAQAKHGMAVELIRQNVLELQSDASDLILQFPGKVSECETSSVIKMAATGSGSHETLTLLLADSALGVLSGRLSLSLSLLGRLAQQLEDQLALSSDVGPNLAAIVFGTKATVSIAQKASEVITALVSAANNNNNNNNNDNDVAEVSLGNGWSLVPETGLQWQSSNGHVSFNPTPTSNKGVGNESKRRKRRKAVTKNPFSILIDSSYSQNNGFAASLDLQHQFNGGQRNFGGSFSDSSGWEFSAGVKFTF
ncbi:hypothetical protein V1264_008296 [Littorina saxatilis]|uniref:Uncharacterized protein n=2 Tax=Littorina saxatilis TaxID=31220 RepID=A0AAN9G3G1_9CAEN